MDDNQNKVQEAVNKTYEYAANLLVTEGKTAYEVESALRNQLGVNAEVASKIVSDLESQMEDARKEAAQKDMLYGALWCIGGIIGTASHIGFVFWGAIVFGAIQFFKGLSNR